MSTSLLDCLENIVERRFLMGSAGRLCLSGPQLYRRTLGIVDKVPGLIASGQLTSSSCDDDCVDSKEIGQYQAAVPDIKIAFSDSVVTGAHFGYKLFIDEHPEADTGIA